MKEGNIQSKKNYICTTTSLIVFIENSKGKEKLVVRVFSALTKFLFELLTAIKIESYLIDLKNSL